jgi:hypothetical protein
MATADESERGRSPSRMRRPTSSVRTTPTALEWTAPTNAPVVIARSDSHSHPGSGRQYLPLFPCMH